MNWVDIRPQEWDDFERGGYPGASEVFEYQSGYKRHCLKAGLLVRLEDGHVLLLGDINASGGYCECCGEHGNIVAYSTDLVDQVARATQRCKCGTHIMSKSRAYAEHHKGLLELDEAGAKHRYDRCGEDT